MSKKKRKFLRDQNIPELRETIRKLKREHWDYTSNQLRWQRETREAKTKVAKWKHKHDHWMGTAARFKEERDRHKKGHLDLGKAFDKLTSEHTIAIERITELKAQVADMTRDEWSAKDLERKIETMERALDLEEGVTGKLRDQIEWMESFFIRAVVGVD